MSVEEILADVPDLGREGVLAALRFAADETYQVSETS